MSALVAVFTCARYPQKSQITSAHLKFVGSRTSVRLRLHEGQTHSLTTRSSPNFPSSCLSVATIHIPSTVNIPTKFHGVRNSPQRSCPLGADVAGAVKRSHKVVESCQFLSRSDSPFLPGTWQLVRAEPRRARSIPGDAEDRPFAGDVAVGAGHRMRRPKAAARVAEAFPSGGASLNGCQPVP